MVDVAGRRDYCLSVPRVLATKRHELECNAAEDTYTTRYLMTQKGGTFARNDARDTARDTVTETEALFDHGALESMCQLPDTIH